MSTISKNLRAFASMLEDVNRAIVVLDKVANVDQYEAECSARVSAIKAKHDEDVARLDASANDRAAAIKKTNDEAAATVAKAKAEAETIVFNAKSAAESLVSASEKKLEEHAAQLLAIKRGIESATATLHSLNDAADKAKKHAAEHEARLAKAREELRKVLGE